MKAIRYLPFVLKQIYRHRTRSALTIAGVTIAMTLYCGVEAMHRGAEAVTRAGAGDTTLIVYRKDRYCPFTSRMPQSYEKRIAALDGVAGVVPMQILVNNCRTSLDVVTFRGVPAEAFMREFSPQLAMLEGALDEWSRRSDAVLLGESLARRRRLSTGDRFDAAGVTVFVAGVFRSDEPQHRNVGYAHLDFLQYAAGSRGGGLVTQFNVRVTEPERLGAVAAAIDAEFAADAEPTHTRPEKAFIGQAAADVLEIVAFARWLGVGCLIGVVALVGNAIVLAVQGRVREHAVLQTLGYRGTTIAALIVAEGTAVSLVGGAAGAIISSGVLAWGGFALSVEGFSVPIEAGPTMILVGVLMSVLLGAVAGLLPAWQASRRTIVECFRAV